MCLQSVCVCCYSRIRRCEAVNDTDWQKLSSWWVGDWTHSHHYALFSCHLPLCGVTSRSSVFCDKFGQIAIISFLNSASICCLSAPPGSTPTRNDPKCGKHYKQADKHIIHIYKHPTCIKTRTAYIHTCTRSPKTRKQFVSLKLSGEKSYLRNKSIQKSKMISLGSYPWRSLYRVLS